ncbi:unnamed protein product, partial [Prorocentrum cordatum]
PTLLPSAFVAPAPSARPTASGATVRGQVARAARGGGEYDVSDADIQAFYDETISGSGGDPPKGSITAELIVKHFHGVWDDKGTFTRYSGQWKGPPPGGIGKRDIAVGIAGLKEQMKLGKHVVKGGPGNDETQKVKDDGKGWVWLAADMSPGGLAVQLYTSVPYGKRPLLVAKRSEVDTMFEKAGLKGFKGCTLFLATLLVYKVRARPLTMASCAAIWSHAFRNLLWIRKRPRILISMCICQCWCKTWKLGCVYLVSPAAGGPGLPWDVHDFFVTLSGRWPSDVLMLRRAKQQDFSVRGTRLSMPLNVSARIDETTYIANVRIMLNGDSLWSILGSAMSLSVFAQCSAKPVIMHFRCGWAGWRLRTIFNRVQIGSERLRRARLAELILQLAAQRRVAGSLLRAVVSGWVFILLFRGPLPCLLWHVLRRLPDPGRDLEVFELPASARQELVLLAALCLSMTSNIRAHPSDVLVAADAPESALGAVAAPISRALRRELWRLRDRRAWPAHLVGQHGEWLFARGLDRDRGGFGEALRAEQQRAQEVDPQRVLVDRQCGAVAKSGSELLMIILTVLLAIRIPALASWALSFLVAAWRACAGFHKRDRRPGAGPSTAAYPAAFCRDWASLVADLKGEARGRMQEAQGDDAIASSGSSPGASGASKSLLINEIAVADSWILDGVRAGLEQTAHRHARGASLCPMPGAASRCQDRLPAGVPAGFIGRPRGPGHKSPSQEAGPMWGFDGLCHCLVAITRWPLPGGHCVPTRLNAADDPTRNREARQAGIRGGWPALEIEADYDFFDSVAALHLQRRAVSDRARLLFLATRRQPRRPWPLAGRIFDGALGYPCRDIARLLARCGQYLYDVGGPVGDFAETVNAVVDLDRSLRRQLQAAWDVVDAWQLLALAPADVLLRSALISNRARAYVRINLPKTRRLAARRQRARFDEPVLLDLLVAWLPRTPERQRPRADSAFQRRRALVSQLGVPASNGGITPASHRAGGATFFFESNDNLAQTRRRGKWTSARALEVYIQEVAAAGLLPDLPRAARDRIRELAAACPELLDLCARALSCACRLNGVWGNGQWTPQVNWGIMDKRIDTTMGGPTLLPSAFVAPAPSARPTASGATVRGQVARAARGGGEYDVSDADIQAFYDETISGSGGDPPKGSITAELIVKHFHGVWDARGTFTRYSGQWKGPPPGGIGKRDIAVGIAGLKEQMKLGKHVVKGGPGNDETQKVKDDGKGWVWLAADMSPGGLAVQLYTSVPYGKRPLLVAKRSEVDTMFEKDRELGHYGQAH